MSKKISWSFTAQVTGGPAVSASVTDLEMDAYGEIDVTIPKNSTDTTVELQPGKSGVKLLVITTSDYDNITYKVNGSTTGVKLDGALILIGEGAIGLLDEYPTEFKFTNANLTKDAAVSILVGRDATPVKTT